MNPSGRLHLNCIAFPVLVVLAVQPTVSQEVLRISLRVKDTVAVERHRLGPLIVQVPLKCDADRNIYLRQYDRTNLGSLPILKISHEGNTADTFDIRSAPGFEQGRADNFAVGLGGEVYILGAKTVGEWHIVKFSKEGQYDSEITLAPFLEPRHLAVFLSGEFLVSGTELFEKDQKPTGRLLSAIYDRSGKLIREISLPRDIELERDVELEKRIDTGGEPQYKSFPLSSTTTVAADDGNIYLMREKTSPVVYVISPAGTVLRRLVIPPPAQDFRPGTMKVAGGKIVVAFEKENPDGTMAQQVFSVVHAQTGEKFADYVPTPEARGIWACYTPAGFTFLTTKGKELQLTIVQATPY